MRKSIAVFVVLLTMSAARANRQFVAAGGNLHVGVVTAVNKKSFTIKPEAGKKMTLTYDPNMGKNPHGFVVPNDPWGVTSDQIKVGMIIWVRYMKEKDVFVCKQARIVVEHLGTREIDFAPLLAKGKDKLPEFVLHIKLQSRQSLGVFRPQTIRIIDFKEGASISQVRDIVKGILFGRDSGGKPRLVRRLTLRGGLAMNGEDTKWNVKEVGEAKLLIESYRKNGKDEPVNSVEIEAKDFPKERQPHVRLVNPRDPTK